MSQGRTSINSLTLVSFRGIFFKTLSLHPLMSNLIGHNGAGKTTIMGGLLLNRVPDNRLIRLRNNSDSGQDRSDNGIWGRIDQGTCYSLVDYTLFNGKRVIAGVQLKRLGKPRVELKLFAIEGIDDTIPVRDLIMGHKGDNRYEALEGNALKNQIAMNGGTLTRFKSLGLYMDWQFACRIIPRRMENSRDRQRYYRMLETSLYGGLSSEMQKGLRDYLLSSDDNVRKSVSSMQNALQETRKTRDSIQDTREKRQFVKDILTSSYELGENVIAWANKQQKQLKQTLLHAQEEKTRILVEIEGHNQQINALENELEQLESVRTQLEEHESSAREKKDQSETLDRLNKESERLGNDIANIQERLKELNQHREIILAQKLEQEILVEQLDEDVSTLMKQLANAEEAYSEEARKAGLYHQALSSLETCRQLTGDETLDDQNLNTKLTNSATQRSQLSDEYHQKQPMLEQMEKIQEHFNTCLPILSELNNDPEPAPTLKHNNGEVTPRKCCCTVRLLAERKPQQSSAQPST